MLSAISIANVCACDFTYEASPSDAHSWPNSLGSQASMHHHEASGGSTMLLNLDLVSFPLTWQHQHKSNLSVILEDMGGADYEG